jgi:hypothetical protein
MNQLPLALNVAILVAVVLILLCLFPAARGCLDKLAPWAALLGGGLLVGALLVGGGGPARKRGGGEHEALDDGPTAAEISAILGEGSLGDEVPSTRAAEPDGPAADEDAADFADQGLGAYVVDVPPLGEAEAANEWGQASV